MANPTSGSERLLVGPVVASTLPEWDAAHWQAYVARLQRIADACLDAPHVVQGGVTP